jgi:transcription elongation factor Elf1
MKEKKIKYPPLRREWYKCPVCGTKLAIIDNNAKCSGVHIKCRTCKKEIEIEV